MGCHSTLYIHRDTKSPILLFGCYIFPAILLRSIRTASLLHNKGRVRSTTSYPQDLKWEFAGYAVVVYTYRLSWSDSSLSVSHPCRHDVDVGVYLGSVPDLVNRFSVHWPNSREKFWKDSMITTNQNKKVRWNWRNDILCTYKFQLSLSFLLSFSWILLLINILSSKFRHNISRFYNSNFRYLNHF